MIYGKFKYITNSDGTLRGINSVLDSLPFTNLTFANQDGWGYSIIDGDISTCDLSLFDFTEVTQEEALTIQKNISPDAILLDNGFFGFPSRIIDDPIANNFVSDEEKMLDPAKWGLDY